MTFRLNGPHINQALQGTPDKITIMSLRNHCLRVGLLLALRHDKARAMKARQGSGRVPHKPLIDLSRASLIIH